MTIVRFPNGRQASLPPGKTILEAAMRARVPLPHRCGGNGSCLTCKVIVRQDEGVSPPNEKEQRMLGESMLQTGFRLGCQCRVYKDTIVELPESRLKAAILTQLKQKNDEDQ